MKVNEKIARRRKELGLTLEDVGKMVGVGKSTVRKWETGDIANMKRDKIASLAKALRVPPSFIMGWEDTDNVASNAIVATGMLPIVGIIQAGMPIFAEENIEGYVPTMVRNPDDYFYLRVHGDSMINAGIPDNSLVLIHKQPSAENGEIVACRVNGDEATLKRYKRVKNTIVLMPENPKYEPILVSCSDFEDNYAEIVGIVKQVVIDI